MEELNDIITTKEDYMGLVMSTESAGLDEARMEKAFADWEFYYTCTSATNFSYLLCYLICKADKHNLYRLSKGYPEHVRVFAEKQLMGLADPDKLGEINGRQ